MIRRVFNLAPPEGDYDDLQVLVTYDPDDDTLLLGYRVNAFDEWSRPVSEVDNQDDVKGGRRGGPGSRVEGGLLGRLIQLVDEYGGADPGDVEPDDSTPVDKP